MSPSVINTFLIVAIVIARRNSRRDFTGVRKLNPSLNKRV